MRLLKRTPDGRFVFVERTGKDIPPYAILSHTWNTDNKQEVTFQDLEAYTGENKAEWRKITFCADQAQLDDLEYFWIDTCCIDKKDAVELAEAINSMFVWYQRAKRCYVLLSDVSVTEMSGAHDPPQHIWEQAFRGSRWFTRGWTLPELLAPRSVEFFSKQGVRLGDKQTLERQIRQTTGVAIEALRGASLSQFGIEERMRWAERRETTKEEDEVYCLLGLFGIHLPLIYGEGKKNALSRLQSEVEKRMESKTIQDPRTIACLQTLRTSNYEQFKDRNPDRLEETCTWFLHHSNYHTWQHASSALLWVSADPGCGKSVLVKFLADQDLRPTDSRVSCHFFFKDDDDVQKDVNHALSALLHQLFSQKRSLLRHAIREHEAEGVALTSSFHKLWNILLKAACDPDAGEVVCILDALDECEESGRYRIIEALSTFYKPTTCSARNSKLETSKLKFIVTSRPYHDIERRFASITRPFPTIRLQGEWESETISREVGAVIKRKVWELGRDLALDQSEQETLESGLARVEHRTYLWLRLILEVVRDEIMLTKTRLKKILNTIPATVEEAYEAILSKIQPRNRPKALKLLRIIIGATRPLNLREMSIALSITENSSSYEDLDLEEEDRFATTIRHLCGLFVNVIDQRVYLIHQTAKEFLVGNTESSAGRWKHSIDQMDSEHLMANTCVIYLGFTEFGSMLRDSEQQSSKPMSSERVESVTEDHGLLSYAASCWSAHFRQIQRKASEKLIQSALALCEPKNAQHWIWFPIFITTTGFNKNLGGLTYTNSLQLASSLGLETVVEKLLITRNDLDVNEEESSFGYTALMLAAFGGHAMVVQHLLKHKDLDINAGRRGPHPDALILAVSFKKSMFIQQLIERGDASADTPSSLTSVTAFLAAFMCGHEEVVKQLLQRDDINITDEDTFILLAMTEWASTNGHVQLHQQLFRWNRKSNDAKDSFLRAILTLAAEQDLDTQLLRTIVQYHAVVGRNHEVEKDYDALLRQIFFQGTIEEQQSRESALVANAKMNPRALALLRGG